MGKNWQTNYSDDRTYKFIGIMKAPAKVKELVLTGDEMVMMLNKLRTKQEELGGPDLVWSVKYKIEDKETGKPKNKVFNFSTHLSPRTLLGVEVVNGEYYIKAEMYGIFY